MRKFEKPIIDIQRFNKEDFVMTSGTCPQIHTCEDCYCAIVTCESAYSCSGLKCQIYNHNK